jgi:hypothetical protein
VLDARALGERLVGVALERHRLAAAIAAVGGDEHLGAGVVDAIAQRFGRETAEHHRVHGADARAGEHGHDRLGDHGQVDRHAIALLHAEMLEHVAAKIHLAVQVPVGQRAAIAGLALPDDRRLVAARAGNVPIDAVHAGVELAAGEPLGVWGRPFEHLIPGVLILLQKRAREVGMRTRLVQVPGIVEQLFEDTRLAPLFEIVRAS